MIQGEHYINMHVILVGIIADVLMLVSDYMTQEYVLDESHMIVRIE